ncbi:YceI family protein [Flavobacterium sp. LC2016-01]|uniref:YceI family protein n=1 Tax=Flavobacterium sp. LC2016-01 TaxID=2675876 RepID=UPI0012BACB40|nr:YceI family protein [Flavobacterium sp. LC2016-01]MTH17711.1 hypothetical protein [Flavobacterium sp. LC2016-01]
MGKTKWFIDRANSEIGFKANHMMFSNVPGEIRKFKSLITTSVDVFDNAKIEFDGQIKSITTEKEESEADQSIADLFYVNQFSKVTFEAITFDKIDEVNYKLTGNLTLCNVTRLVTFDAEFSGLLKEPWGVIKASFIITGIINRTHWDLNMNRMFDTGIPISEELKLNIDLRFIRR